MAPADDEPPATRATDKRCMIDCRSLEKAAQRPLRQRRRGPCRGAASLLLNLLWVSSIWVRLSVELVMGSGCRNGSARETPGEPAGSDVKLALWRRLVAQSVGSSSTSEEALSQLAHKLNRWPDQREAALFFMDLLAHHESPTNQDYEDRAARPPVSSSASPRARTDPPTCLPVTLNQLTTSKDEAEVRGLGVVLGCGRHGVNDGAASSSPSDDSWLQLKRLQETSQLREPQVVGSLNRQARVKELASLALEIANLATRLLAQSSPSNHWLSSIASPDFFRYIISSRLAALADDWATQPDGSSSESPLVALGLVHLQESPTRRLRQQTRRPRLADVHFETWQLFGYEPATSSAPSLRNLESSDSELAARVSAANESERHLAQLPWLAKWVLEPAATPANMKQHEEEQQQKRKNQRTHQKSEKGSAEFGRESGARLSLSDGSWFSPQLLECNSREHSARWLLIYSIPFFGWSANHNQQEEVEGEGEEEGEEEEGNNNHPMSSYEMRGVSFVALDFERTQLMDQCASEGSLFANSHACGQLDGSQCVPLENNYNKNKRLAFVNGGASKRARAGGYICQCPANMKPALEAQQRRLGARDQLTELILARATINASHALDQLALEPPVASESWQQPALSDSGGGRLLEGSRPLASSSSGAGGTSGGDHAYQSSFYYFEWGAQLEADRRLNWFAPDSVGPLPVSAPLSCNLCPGNGRQCSAAEELAASLWPGPRRWTLVVWLRYAIVVVQGFFCIASLLLIPLLLHVRRSRIIVASGWLMLSTLLLGAFLLYSSVLVHALQPPNSLSCLMESWLRELGFSFFFGSILIKLYRILTEFQTRKAHRVCLREKDQILYLLGFVLIVVCYMSAWTALLLDGFSLWAPRLKLELGAHAPTGRQAAAAGPERLFAHLIESRPLMEVGDRILARTVRCRKLTWDYVTELSELAVLLFGIRFIYKLWNANLNESQGAAEKGVLSAAIFLQLIVSLLANCLRHFLWDQLSPIQLLALYTIRCQLSVTPTLGLIFCPKFWRISRGKASLAARANQAAANARHRCHISCELHDHHLTDAVQLHQAMISQSAINIGHINLADMDPDEIKAELKRVYAQLELMKTKVMRRDNPHISKRRGGTKSSHRKFSLQAFHAKHTAHHSSLNLNLNNSSQTNSNCNSNNSNQGHPTQQSILKSRPSLPMAAADRLCPPDAPTTSRLSVPEEADELLEAAEMEKNDATQRQLRAWQQNSLSSTTGD